MSRLGLLSLASHNTHFLLASFAYSSLISLLTSDE